MLKQTDLNTAIIKYIDKKYQPESDEEFVKIYNRLQNMTTEEFQKETADAKDEDMAFKNISGYDILKKYKASHSPTMDKITNIVWQKYLINDIKISDTTPHIQYKKLQKKVRGAYYTHGKTYDDLYRSFKYSLTGLNYEKMFNKYKDINYKKYGVMPAYPKIDVIDNKMIEDEIEIIDTKIAEYAGIIRSKKLNLQAYETTDKITALLSKIPDNKKLTKTQAQILNTLVGEFITDFYNVKLLFVTLAEGDGKLLNKQKIIKRKYFKKKKEKDFAVVLSIPIKQEFNVIASKFTNPLNKEVEALVKKNM